MKVVLFCGGLGLRMRQIQDATPKPLIAIGRRPILWHVMKYYAHYGHKDFILALGYKSEQIKKYFLDYDECESNDFVIEDGKRKLLGSDLHDWRITFVDTGVLTPIGERLLRVRDYVGKEETFLANYTDSLTDCPLPRLIDHFHRHEAAASFLCVKPPLSYHIVSMTNAGTVNRIEPIRSSLLRINGGFFVLNSEIFKYIQPGDELVDAPFSRLIDNRQLLGYRYDGFWASMDTLKDRQKLEELQMRGEAPWEVWRGRPQLAAENGRYAATSA